MSAVLYKLDELTFCPQQEGPGKCRGFLIMAHKVIGHAGADELVFKTGQILEGLTYLDRIEYSNYILRALLFEELSQAAERLTGDPLVIDPKSLFNDVPSLVAWVQPWRPI